MGMGGGAPQAAVAISYWPRGGRAVMARVEETRWPGRYPLAHARTHASTYVIQGPNKDVSLPPATRRPAAHLPKAAPRLPTPERPLSHPNIIPPPQYIGCPRDRGDRRQEFGKLCRQTIARASLFPIVPGRKGVRLSSFVLWSAEGYAGQGSCRNAAATCRFYYIPTTY